MEFLCRPAAEVTVLDDSNSSDVGELSVDKKEDVSADAATVNLRGCQANEYEDDDSYEDESGSEYYSYDDMEVGSCQGSRRAVVRARFAGRTEMAELHGGAQKNIDMSHAVQNSLLRGQIKAEAPRNRGLTRDTRATVEQVLDGRTVALLNKMKQWQVYDKLCGCISTGKEANVYLGLREGVDGQIGSSRAIKVFKTSILVFKDRAKYVEGEYRFKRGYAKGSNPRKMVVQWAEKEYRNLRRLTSCGIRSPIPVELRGHVIAMSFLGDLDGTPSPRLKTLIHVKPKLPSSFWSRIYVEIIATLRTLFQKCKLVHGDFSEYNLLFHQGHCYVIDVSQSVESSQARFGEFLRIDCINVHRFFQRLLGTFSVTDLELEEDATTVEDDATLAIQYLRSCFEDPLGLSNNVFVPLNLEELYQYITSEELILPDSNVIWPEYDELEKNVSIDQSTVATQRPGALMGKGVTVILNNEEINEARLNFGKLCSNSLEYLRQREVPNVEIDQETFLNLSKPLSLNEITPKELEKEMERIENNEPLVYSYLAKSTLPNQPDNLSDGSSSAATDVASESDGEGLKQIRGNIPEGMDPKEWKRIIKEQKREKRKTKIAKHIKKRRTRKK